MRSLNSGTPVIREGQLWAEPVYLDQIQYGDTGIEEHNITRYALGHI